MTNSEIIELSLLMGALSRLRSTCRAHQLPPGRCRCKGCPLEDACAEHLEYADSLGEFCTDAIRNIKESEAIRRREP